MGRRHAPALWLLYVVIVLEILFMISPAALYFYSVYGPGLNLLHRSPATTWLTTFFLPHFSDTTSWLLRLQQPLAVACLAIGGLVFLVAFGQIYVAKLRQSGPVSSGLYRLVRHPQYAALAVLGLGTLLLWPRFLALVMYATMLCLYAGLARREEAWCRARFGEAYDRYVQSTGRFFPRLVRTGREAAPAPRRGVVAGLARGGAVVLAAVALGFVLRDYSLTRISGVYEPRLAVLSPALLTAEELREAYRVAAADPAAGVRLPATGPLLVYVLPEAWHLPDLPAEPYRPGSGGHVTPKGFDRTRLKVLFTRPRTHAVAPAGIDIVRTAYGREPILLVHLDLAERRVVSIDTPPPHVLWGDIPTPMY
jgi:protein-S-isoprenylcysteine O-methyltransferase Ste14